jgi:DNA-binding XRE family transcriptional regulator
MRDRRHNWERDQEMRFLKILMLQSGLGPHALAKKVGVSGSTLFKLFSGDRPRWRLRIAINRFFSKQVNRVFEIPPHIKRRFHVS